MSKRTKRTKRKQKKKTQRKHKKSLFEIYRDLILHYRKV